MSENQSFMPLTPQLGIAGSSYMLQMGQVNGYWAIRLVKGSEVLDSHIFKDSKELPNGNKLTGWVLSVLVLPNLNTYQIQKTVGFIRQKALRNIEEQELARKTAGKAESKEVKLEKTPENTIKRPSSQGWVKEEENPNDEGKISAEEVSPVLAASNKAATARTAPSEIPQPIVVGDRKLQPIPRGEDFVPNPNPYAGRGSGSKSGSKASGSTVKSSSGAVASLYSNSDNGSGSVADSITSKDINTLLVKSSEYLEVLKRLDRLEERVNALQNENSTLRKEIAFLKKE